MAEQEEGGEEGLGLGGGQQPVCTPFPLPRPPLLSLTETDQSDWYRADMAEEQTGDKLEPQDLEFQDHGGHIPKRHARVTVKYNRKELQRRLDVEKWIDESLDRLYKGQVGQEHGQQAVMKK